MSASREKKQRQDTLTGGPTEKQRREAQEAQKHRNKKILYWVVGIVIAALVIALLVWNSNFFQRRTTAATIGDKNYTVTDVSFYYNNVRSSFINMQEQYAQLYGQFGMEFTRYYDTSKSAADQTVTEENLAAMANIGLSGPEVGQTYDDYFKQQALDSLQYEALMCDAAKAEGYTLSAEGQKTVDDTIKNFESTASQQNMTLSVYLRYVFGEYMTTSVFKEHMTNSTLASEYQKHKQDSFTYTEDELKAYADENKGVMDTYEYRLAFIDGQPEEQKDAEGNVIEATEEQKTAALASAKAKADTMAELVEGGADFNETAAQYVAEASAAQYDDPEYNHKTNDLGSSLSLTSYGAWLTDGTHKAGDVGVVEEAGGTGYYVVQLLKSWLDTDSVYSADVRHILVKAETGSGEDAAPAETTPSESGAPEASPAPSTETTEPTEAQYEAAKAKAEEIRAQFEAGDKTPEAFGELAKQYSEDPGSKDNGGLYEDVSQSSGFFADFTNWCLDPARKPGDLGLIQNTQTDQWGYHLMYFQEAGPKVWQHTAETALRSKDYTAWYDGVKGDYAATAVAKGMGMI